MFLVNNTMSQHRVTSLRSARTPSHTQARMYTFMFACVNARVYIRIPGRMASKAMQGSCNKKPWGKTLRRVVAALSAHINRRYVLQHGQGMKGPAFFGRFTEEALAISHCS